MISKELSKLDYKRMHWMSLALALPVNGTGSKFPSTESCRVRLSRIRWPSGPTCIRCGWDDVGYLNLRKIFYCRFCHHQFSVTAGTFMHRSRIDLRMWFTAGEDFINAFARGNDPTGHSVSELYQISYAAAYRLKKLAKAELTKPEGGLLGRSICDSERPDTPELVESPGQRFFRLFNSLSDLDAEKIPD